MSSPTSFWDKNGCAMSYCRAHAKSVTTWELFGGEACPCFAQSASAVVFVTPSLGLAEEVCVQRYATSNALYSMYIELHTQLSRYCPRTVRLLCWGGGRGSVARSVGEKGLQTNTAFRVR